MKPHDESIALDRLHPAPSAAGERVNQWAAACAALAMAVLLWTFGAGLHHHSPSHSASNSRTNPSQVWDKHQDAARAVAAILPAPSRRPPHSPTQIAVACADVRPAPAGYRLAEERRPAALSPHLSQIRLRAPPPVLA